MIVYPAVDIKGGKCVRLAQGQFNRETVYSDDPLDAALKWEKAGARYLHVIDLDGARTGKPQNIAAISRMSVNLGIPVQVGGGIRSIETIEIILCKGIQRIILGTSAVRDQELVKKALKDFGSSIVIAIDAREGMVAIDGWAKTSEFTAVGFAKKMEDLGAKVIIYTDISKDGMLSGPNLRAMEEMTKAVGIEVIAAGGVSSVDDVRNLKDAGLSGVIIGKALYTGDIDLAEAIRTAE